MDTNLPLRPQGGSFQIQATPSAPAAATLIAGGGAGDMVVAFDGTRMPSNAHAWIGYGASSSAAVAAAVVPIVAGAPKPNVLQVPSGSITKYTLTAGTFVAAIMESGSSTIGGTVGIGV